jgi:hypothetical protein
MLRAGNPNEPLYYANLITYRKASLRVAEVFFDEKFGNRGNSDLDLIRHFYCSHPVPGARSTKIYTLWISLRQEPQSLLTNMSRATRAQLRQAAKENFKCEFSSAPTNEWTTQFFDFFDRFADSMRLKRVNRRRLLALRKKNSLDLSRISSSEGKVLVWHANIRRGEFAFCLYSSSLFRNHDRKMAAYIGRANRLLHWQDILRFRDEGVSTYDFGGWYPGSQNEALLNVNRFKESFGGELVVQYNCDVPLTPKGALALWLRAAARSVTKVPDVPVNLGHETEVY